jgi:hypothetical protein
MGGWVGPRSIPDTVVKRKIPSPHRESKPRTPIVQPYTVGIDIMCFKDEAFLSLLEYW